jgi:2-phospho-L-lactate guanylyltransferase
MTSSPPDHHQRPAHLPFLVTALIPVKALEGGKSRLSGRLDPDDRIRLTHDSLRHVVHVLQSTPRIGEIIVITRDAQVAEWAEWWRVSCLREQGRGLNAALRQAREQRADAQAILVLPSDLVAISATDVQAILDLAERAPGRACVVIAPDRRSRGTNALLLKPPGVIAFEFGSHSAERHAALAVANGVQPLWYRSDSISLDLDVPEDLELYWDQW